jgi:hypothetical protein
MHNARRYARDAYATTLLCQRPHCHFVVARRDVNKDPLQPSRLLFACEEDRMIARAGRLFSEKKAAPKSAKLLLGAAPLTRSTFKPPKPEPPATLPQQISVTDFKLYLASPYRYYLRRIKKLQAVDDSARELDAMSFGTLVHGVLGAFGRDTRVRNTVKAKTILQFLMDELARLVQQQFGGARGRPALRLQLELARRGLHAFAERQVALVEQGWRIVYAEPETREKLEAPFLVDGEPISLIGRMDRIDLHEGDGVLRILDYKTSAGGAKPERTHYSNNRWVDLQLPLYRHLWPKALVKTPKVLRTELGYFNLPKRMQDTGVAVAPWSDEQLEGADDVARQVIRDIRAGAFDKPGATPDDDEYASICMTNTLVAPELVDDERPYDPNQ